MQNKNLLLRQQQLISHSAHLRASIADQSQVLIKPLAFADKVQDGVNWLCRNPTWPVGAVLVLLVLKPRKAIVWGSRFWGAWKIVKRLQESVEKAY
jgi:hypothetical protein